MSNRVYTYARISELKQAPFFNEIAVLPQLTMSEEMKHHMCREMRVLRPNTKNFAFFQLQLFPGWNTAGQRFAYLTILNRFIREEIEKTQEKAEREWLFGCKKNLFSAVNNVIRLEEAGIRPDDIKETDRDLLLFVRMWKLLEKENRIIREFRETVQKYKDTAVFDAKVNQIFRFHGNKAIVWHGFQYLTPLQQYVYDCFVRAGYDIYALIQNDERYPYANEIWDHLYTQKNGFPEKSNWIRHRNHSFTNPLGEIFETGENVSAPGIKIIKYNNTIDFVEDIKRLKKEGEEYYIYCADDRAANNLLKDYYPDRYEVRNLLAYPIGQFIYTLHKMWDETQQCVTLDPTGVRKCFASGWLSAKGRSSIHYTDDLERLLPYFEGCYTVDEWSERLDQFSIAYDDAISVFPAETEENKGVMANPLKQFGVFSIDEKRIDHVIMIIGTLIKMATNLFGKNEPVSIQNHMSKLDAMLYMNDGMPRDLYLKEKEIVKQIFSALESENVRDFLCYPGDLATALISFMGGQLDEDDAEKRQVRDLVFNIYQVDSAPISAKGRVHICMADISKLPGSEGQYGWPMDEALLRGIATRCENTYLQNWIENNQLIALANRFYITSALNNEHVEISWIQKQGEKLFSPSPYITLLEKLSDIKIEENTERNLNLEKVMRIMAKKRLDKGFSLKQNLELHTYDADLEYASCPMRFVYSQVLSAGNAYRSEYQQNMAIIRLIQAIKQLMGDKYSVEKIAQQVFELFPNIRKAEKRQMIDDALRYRLPEVEGDYTTVGELQYTNYRINLSFLDEGAYKSAQKYASMLMSQEGRKGIFFDRMGHEDARNCEFCPHGNYCLESLFGVDYKGERE